MTHLKGGGSNAACRDRCSAQASSWSSTSSLLRRSWGSAESKWIQELTWPRIWETVSHVDRHAHTHVDKRTHIHECTTALLNKSIHACMRISTHASTDAREHTHMKSTDTHGFRQQQPTVETSIGVLSESTTSRRGIPGCSGTYRVGPDGEQAGLGTGERFETIERIISAIKILCWARSEDRAGWFPVQEQITTMPGVNLRREKGAPPTQDDQALPQI